MKLDAKDFDFDLIDKLQSHGVEEVRISESSVEVKFSQGHWKERFNNVAGRFIGLMQTMDLIANTDSNCIDSRKAAQQAIDRDQRMKLEHVR